MGWLSRFFGARHAKPRRRVTQLFLHNTLSGKKELFIPLHAGTVSLYTCGPTVYSRQHIGNLRSAVFSDTLARTLARARYLPRRVINITDVGHLTGDDDRGEDKVEVEAARQGVSAEEIANRYAKLFLDDLAELNVDTRHIFFPRASEYLREQIALAQTLEEKGFAYRTKDGLYFDTRRFPSYGALAGVAQAHLRPGARVEVNPEKRSPEDFALWKKTPPSVHRLQEWDAPWGRGFPGWNLECSAMAQSLLGPQIDIHTGGEDLAAIHHNNEIAQSEAASGRQFVRYWMHNAFLTMGGEKVSKSTGNVVYLSDLKARGLHPLSLRYFFLQAHYRTPLSFSFEAAEAADRALRRLWRAAESVRERAEGNTERGEFVERFLAFMRDDLATPQALSILWQALENDELSFEEKHGLLEEAEAHFALSLLSPPASEASEPPPPEIAELVGRRERARTAKDFKEADHLRAEIERSGYRVDDAPEGPVVVKKHL